MSATTTPIMRQICRAFTTNCPAPYRPANTGTNLPRRGITYFPSGLLFPHRPMTPPLPWYDAVWLNHYVAAKAIIQRTRPGLLPKFVESFDRFRTRPDFVVQQIKSVFDEATMTKIRATIPSLRVHKIETHETRTLGRLIVHNQPCFTEPSRPENRAHPLQSAGTGRRYPINDHRPPLSTTHAIVFP